MRLFTGGWTSSVVRKEPPMYPVNVGSKDVVGTARRNGHGHDDALGLLQHLFSTTLIHVHMKILSRVPNSLENVWFDS